MLTPYPFFSIPIKKIVDSIPIRKKNSRSYYEIYATGIDQFWPVLLEEYISHFMQSNYVTTPLLRIIFSLTYIRHFYFNSAMVHLSSSRESMHEYLTRINSDWTWLLNLMSTWSIYYRKISWSLQLRYVLRKEALCMFSIQTHLNFNCPCINHENPHLTKGHCFKMR